MDIKPIRCSPVKLNVADVETAAKFSGAVYSDGIWWKELFKGFWWPFDIQEVFRVGIKPPLFKKIYRISAFDQKGGWELLFEIYAH